MTKLPPIFSLDDESTRAVFEQARVAQADVGVMTPSQLPLVCRRFRAVASALAFRPTKKDDDKPKPTKTLVVQIANDVGYDWAAYFDGVLPPSLCESTTWTIRLVRAPMADAVQPLTDCVNELERRGAQARVVLVQIVLAYSMTMETFVAKRRAVRHERATLAKLPSLKKVLLRFDNFTPTLPPVVNIDNCHYNILYGELGTTLNGLAALEELRVRVDDAAVPDPLVLSCLCAVFIAPHIGSVFYGNSSSWAVCLRVNRSDNPMNHQRVVMDSHDAWDCTPLSQFNLLGLFAIGHLEFVGDRPFLPQVRGQLDLEEPSRRWTTLTLKQRRPMPPPDGVPAWLRLE